MRYDRKNTVISILLLLILTIGVGVWDRATKEIQITNSYSEPLKQAPELNWGMQGIANEWEIDDSFQSHLPIIIIDTGSDKPPINTKQDTDGTFKPIPGVEPYRDGKIMIIDTGEMNRITDRADQESLIRIKRRGNSSMLYEKAQYLVKLVTESGQDKYLDLLGMGAEREWILNGSMADKSMMRNYLAYRLGSQILPYTPDSKYCEVIYYIDGKYYYEGVYLLTESIKQGEERVAISEAKSTDPFPSYIVRRDREASDEIILDTWATKNHKSIKYIGLIYPTMKNANPENIGFITQDISKIEQILYSNDPEVFSTYSRYIDVDSFIDYFLINEFLGSYDAGMHSTYMYKEIGGKLHMGPIWDFDNALDNYIKEPLDREVTTFQTRPWFDRLMQDLKFVKKMEQRYAELRRGPLSDDAFLGTIDMVTAHLGPAIEREWTRWGHIYKTFNRYSMQNYGENLELVRNTNTHQLELLRLKTSITQHAKAIGPYLRLLEKSATVNTDISFYAPLILFVAVLIFAIPAFYASRK